MKDPNDLTEFISAVQALTDRMEAFASTVQACNTVIRNNWVPYLKELKKKMEKANQ